MKLPDGKSRQAGAYMIVITEATEHYVAFNVYGLSNDDDYDAENNSYINDEDAGDSPVDTIDKASVFAHGDVKWDGCSNWKFDAQDRSMLHFCSFPGLGDMMDAAYRFCAEQMPGKMIWDYIKDRGSR